MGTIVLGTSVAWGLQSLGDISRWVLGSWGVGSWGVGSWGVGSQGGRVMGGRIATSKNAIWIRINPDFHPCIVLYLR